MLRCFLLLLAAVVFVVIAAAGAGRVLAWKEGTLCHLHQGNTDGCHSSRRLGTCSSLPVVPAINLVDLRRRSCPIPIPRTILRVQLTPNAIRDYNRARHYLRDLAKSDGIHVYTCLTDAVEKYLQLSLTSEAGRMQ